MMKNSFAENFDSYLEKRKNQTNNAAKEIKKIVKQFNLTGTVKFTINGYGDSGELEDAKWNVNPSLQEVTQKEIENLIYDLLPDGWEINEGSYNTITLNCNKGKCKIVVDYGERVEEINHQRFNY